MGRWVGVQTDFYMESKEVVEEEEEEDGGCKGKRR